MTVSSFRSPAIARVCRSRSISAVVCHPAQRGQPQPPGRVVRVARCAPRRSEVVTDVPAGPRGNPAGGVPRRGRWRDLRRHPSFPCRAAGDHRRHGARQPGPPRHAGGTADDGDQQAGLGVLLHPGPDHEEVGAHHLVRGPGRRHRPHDDLGYDGCTPPRNLFFGQVTGTVGTWSSSTARRSARSTAGKIARSGTRSRSLASGSTCRWARLRRSLRTTTCARRHRARRRGW